MYVHTPLGQARTQMAILSCPHCSYLSQGECVICPNGDPHPACEGCVDGRLPPLPWYKHELAIAIATATIVSVASTVLIVQLKKHTGFG